MNQDEIIVAYSIGMIGGDIFKHGTARWDDAQRDAVLEAGKRSSPVNLIVGDKVFIAVPDGWTYDAESNTYSAEEKKKPVYVCCDCGTLTDGTHPFCAHCDPPPRRVPR